MGLCCCGSLVVFISMNTHIWRYLRSVNYGTPVGNNEIIML